MAALEAWRQCGGKQALQNLSDLKDQFMHVLAASEQDDKKDDDNDGVKCARDQTFANHARTQKADFLGTRSVPYLETYWTTKKNREE
jgi:hypothetical protein